MGSTLFRDPQARSSALAALGTPQPRAFGSLNRVDPLDSASNLYIDTAKFNVITNRSPRLCELTIYLENKLSCISLKFP